MTQQYNALLSKYQNMENVHKNLISDYQTLKNENDDTL